MLRMREGKAGSSKAGHLAHYLAESATPNHEQALSQYLTRSAIAAGEEYKVPQTDPFSEAAAWLARSVESGLRSYADAESNLLMLLAEADAAGRARDPVHQTVIGGASMEMLEQRASDMLLSAVDRTEAPEPPPGRGVALPGHDMHPDVSDLLRLPHQRPINADQLAHILAGRAGDGTELPAAPTGRKREVAYFEFVFSAPKSFSVAYATGDAVQRAAIVQAHRHGIDVAFRAMASELATHRGTGEQGQLAAYDIEHINSRPTVEIASGDTTELRAVPVRGDPNLHTHRIVPNVQAINGEAYALNSRAMNRRTMEFDAIYQAAMTAEARRLGISVSLQDNAAEITAVPKHVREHFSKRDRSAKHAAREWAKANGLGDWDNIPDAVKLKLIDGAIKSNRLPKDGDFGDFEDWRRQADAIGYQQRGVIKPGTSWRPAPDRLERAWQLSLPLLERELQSQAVLPASTVRTIAARGLIAAGGLDDWRDVGGVTRLYWERGVRQDGRHTTLLWGRDADGAVYVSTRLHEDLERRFVTLAREGHNSRRHSLPEGTATRKAEALGLTLDTAHGRAQQRAMESLATGGDVAVAFGAAGSGKTTMLRPVVEAYQERGFSIYGISLANRQALELTDAGIPRDAVMAVHPFLARVRDGAVTLTAGSVVVVDEVALLGTRQALELLELQGRHRFKLIAVGGPEQSQSIEAGSSTDLFVRAMGKAAIPNIDITVRQNDQHERMVVGLLREGKTLEALTLKRDAGDLEFVPGGREETHARVAAEYARIRREEPGASVAIGTTSHREAHDIGVAVRKALGIGPALVTVQAQQGDGETRGMEVARGERIRLYSRVWGKTPDGRSVHVGDNGHVVEVLKANAEGVQFRARNGDAAAVRWDALAPKGGTPRLSYGYAQTTIIVQGATEDHYLAAIPGGSRTLSANALYVHGSRHRRTARIFISDGQERQDVIAKRQAGETGPITPDDLLKNAAANIGKPGDKDTAYRFMERVNAVHRASARTLTRAVAHAHDIRAQAPSDAGMAQAAAALRLRTLNRHPALVRAQEPPQPARQRQQGQQQAHRLAR